MLIEKMKISDLVPAPYNPRKSNAKQEQDLKNSLEKFGVVEPIIFNKQTGFIVGGHFRVRELKKLGYTEVECVIVDLSPEDERELNVRLNANTGEFDWEQLNSWDKIKLEEWGLDVSNFEDEVLEAVEDDFDTTLQEEAITVLGDLYEIGEHRLLCGDSTDSDAVARLMNGEKADMVFTSPPYNANAKSSQGSVFNSKKSVKLYSEGYSDDLESNDYLDFVKSVLNNCFLFTDGFIFWNVNYNSNSRFEYVKQIYNHLEFLVEQICWKKTAIPYKGCLMRSWEPIYVFSTNKKNIGNDSVISNHWEISNTNSQHENHKACFPIGLPLKAISLKNEFKTVLEPFLGSGTTMAASHQLKRKCYGMELDPKYCDVIVRRMIKLDPTLIIKRNGVITKDFN